MIRTQSYLFFWYDASTKNYKFSAKKYKTAFYSTKISSKIKQREDCIIKG